MKMKDERIVENQRKIASEALRLVLLFLLSSMLYKQFILNADLTDYIIEAIGFFGATFYIVFRNISGGNYDDSVQPKKMKKKTLLISIINSVVMLATFTFLNVQNNSTDVSPLDYIICFLVALVGSYAFMTFMDWLGRRKLEKMTEEWEDE